MDLNDSATRQRLAEFIARAAHARSARSLALGRIADGAIQENWALDAELTGGPRSGTQSWVLRADARAAVRESLTRAQEFAVLQVAHAADLYAPRPLWLCAL